LKERNNDTRPRVISDARLSTLEVAAKLVRLGRREHTIAARAKIVACTSNADCHGKEKFAVQAN
jgi:hypothetical protein